ncbi:HSP18 transcriptional regulator [Actinokineospora globicatena]|uniref:HSP18 transcriptional regulator n=1 Tax=Actinokineospora globicatena TaxID=103729 RepID=UPI0020A4E50C|nr:HSP18 transcriptional regulator [Actinokineospora globicatena]MCP2303741.1 hypothetical protein [Actinokineospora globicatena]GLW79110.1 hypothetical protein Aglo01_35920 [Actinokineospora globicatena]GLW86480.1 hypothetical protein Aglo02_41190 [Actinokineospora globicatena]
MGDDRDDARSHLSTGPAGQDDAIGDLALVHAVAEQGTGEAEDVLAALTLLRHIRDELAGWEPRLIEAARDAGVSWARIAPALGVASRQAAERRYLRVRPDGTTTSTGEQRVRAERDRRAGDKAVVRWARDNAVLLRRLAAAVSVVDDLDHDGQRSVDDVTTALGGADTADLLSPLTDAGPHLRDAHPDLADRITAVADQLDRARHDAGS